MATKGGGREARIPVAIGISATAYLAWLFCRNAIKWHGLPWNWMGDELARRPLLLSAVAAMALGITLIGIALFRKSSTTAIIAGFVILVLALGLESQGLLVRNRHERMIRSMVALRELGNVAAALRNDKGEFPEELPKSLRASAMARDGWGHEIVYRRVAADEAYLLSLGADGLQDVEFHQGMRSNPDAPRLGVAPTTFSGSDFNHDIVYKLGRNGIAGFITHPEGNSSGDSCLLLSAFGCFAY